MSLKFPKPENKSDLDLGAVHVLQNDIREHLMNISIMQTLLSYLPKTENDKTRLIITLESKDLNQPAMRFPFQLSEELKKIMLETVKADKDGIEELILELGTMNPIIEKSKKPTPVPTVSNA